MGHLDIVERIKRSCQVAAISVQSPGTQISYPYKKDLPPHLLE